MRADLCFSTLGELERARVREGARVFFSRSRTIIFGAATFGKGLTARQDLPSFGSMLKIPAMSLLVSIARTEGGWGVQRDSDRTGGGGSLDWALSPGLESRRVGSDSPGQGLGWGRPETGESGDPRRSERGKSSLRTSTRSEIPPALSEFASPNRVTVTLTGSRARLSSPRPATRSPRPSLETLTNRCVPGRAPSRPPRPASPRSPGSPEGVISNERGFSVSASDLPLTRSDSRHCRPRGGRSRDGRPSLRRD